MGLMLRVYIFDLGFELEARMRKSENRFYLQTYFLLCIRHLITAQNRCASTHLRFLLLILQLFTIPIITTACREEISVETKSGTTHTGAEKTTFGPSSSNQPSNLQNIPANKTRLKLKLHDHPTTLSDLTNVFLDLEEVQVVNASGEISVISKEARQIDLLSLKENAAQLIGEVQIPAGEYEQIRLVLGENSKIVSNGETHPLKVPSGSESGLKLSGSFMLRGGRITEILLDFSAERSVQFNKGQGFLLQPVIKVSSVVSLSEAQEEKLTAALGTQSTAMLETSNYIAEVTVSDPVKVELEASSLFETELPYTYWSVQVVDTLKGTVQEELTVRVVGGTVGEDTYKVSHAPEFNSGDHSIIFLTTYPDGKTGVNEGALGKVDL